MKKPAPGGSRRFLSLMTLAIVFAGESGVTADELTLAIGSGDANRGTAIAVPVELVSGVTLLEVLCRP